MFLPATLWGEKPGTVTNLEGRVQRVGRKVAPEGTAMDDWRIAAELALRLGADFDLATVDEVTDEIARVAPAFAGVDAALLRRARDGVVLPLARHADEIVLDAAGPPITDASWEPILPGTIASEEGVTSHVGTGVVEATGTGSTTTVKPGLTEVEGPERSRAEADAIGSAARDAVAAGPRLHEWDRSHGTLARPGSRRVRSAPRVGPHALRRRTRSAPRRRRSPRSPQGRRSSSTRATATRSASPTARRCRSPAGAGSVVCRSRADARRPARGRVPGVHRRRARCR